MLNEQDTSAPPTLSKVRASAYRGVCHGIGFLVAKTSAPYTSISGHKAYLHGWGFVLDCDENPALSPAFSTRKQATKAAQRAIARQLRTVK